MKSQVNPLKIWMVCKGLTPTVLAKKAGIHRTTCFAAISQEGDPSNVVFNKLLQAIVETDDEKKELVELFFEWRLQRERESNLEDEGRKEGTVD